MADRFGYRRTNDLSPAKPPAKVKVDKLAIAFQPDAVEVELRRLPNAARLALYAMVALLLAAVVWAWWAQIDRTISARGKLVSQSRTVVKQPFRASVIRSLDVRPGDIVEKGRLIASLDPTVAKADTGQLTSKFNLISAELARLQAERTDGAFVLPADPNDAMLQQAALFERRDAERITLIEGFAARIDALISQRDVAAAQEAQMKALLDFARVKLASAAQLAKDGAGAAIREKEAESEVLRLLAQEREKVAEQQRYDRQIRVVEVEREQFLRTRATQIEDRHLAASAERAQLQFDLQKAEQVAQFDAFYAETDGIILEVTQKSVGSVVETAEVLFTLVPTDEGLDIELELEARDIGWVLVGQSVRAKLDPFPFQRHGTLEGILSSISPDAFQRQVGGQTQVYYRARVTITQNQLRSLPEGFKLLPGITTTAEIRIGRRSVLSYITDPFHRALDESLKEPN